MHSSWVYDRIHPFAPLTRGRKEDTDGTRKQYYNPSAGGTVSSFNSYTPSAITNFAPSIYRTFTLCTDDDSGEEYECASDEVDVGTSTTISLRYDELSYLYAMYESSKKVNVYSGLYSDKTNHQIKCKSTFYSVWSSASIPTTCTIKFPTEDDTKSIGDSSAGWSKLGYRDDSNLTSTVEYAFGSQKSINFSDNPSYYAIYSRSVSFKSGIGGSTTDASYTQYYNSGYWNTTTQDRHVLAVGAWLDPVNITSYTVTNSLTGNVVEWNISWLELGYHCGSENNFLDTEDQIHYNPYMEDVIAPAYNSGNTCAAIYVRRFILKTGISGSTSDSGVLYQFYNSVSGLTPILGLDGYTKGAGWSATNVITNTTETSYAGYTPNMINSTWGSDISDIWGWRAAANNQTPTDVVGMTPPVNLGYANDTQGSDEWRNNNLVISYGRPIPLYAIYERTITFKSGVSAGTTNKTEGQKYVSTGILEGVTTPTSITYIGNALGGTSWSTSGWTNGTGAIAGTAKNAKVTPAVNSTAITYYGTYYRNVNFYHNSATPTTIKQYYNCKSGNVSSVTRPALDTLDGWGALGWRDDETDFTKEYNANTSYTPAASDTVASQYGIYRRVITFQYGSNVALASTLFQYRRAGTNGTITAPSTVGTTPNYWTFIGWRDDTTAGVQEINPGATVTPNSVTTYYAVWSRQLNVAINTNGADGPSSANKVFYMNSGAIGTLSGATVTIMINSASYYKPGYVPTSVSYTDSTGVGRTNSFGDTGYAELYLYPSYDDDSWNFNATINWAQAATASSA